MMSDDPYRLEPLESPTQKRKKMRVVGGRSPRAAAKYLEHRAITARAPLFLHSHAGVRTLRHHQIHITPGAV